MKNIDDVIYCIACRGDNVEQIELDRYLCGTCETVFDTREFLVDFKISNKSLMLETGEMEIGEIVDGSIDYIFKKGVILGPDVEEQIRTEVGNVPNEVILEKLAQIELNIEDIMEK